MSWFHQMRKHLKEQDRVKKTIFAGSVAPTGHSQEMRSRLAWTTASPSLWLGRDTKVFHLFFSFSYWRHQGDLVPGKLHPGYKMVYVPWGGGEHAKKNNYEVLTLTGANLVWKQAADGHVPKNAVQGGETSSGQPLFVIRAKVEGSDVVGKVNPQNKFGHVPYGGKEHIVKNYEVLVQRNNKQSLRSAPSSQPRVHTEVRQRKVETFRRHIARLAAEC